MNYSLSQYVALGFYRILMFLLYVIARLVGWVYSAQSFHERLGFYPSGELSKLSTGQRIWLHAASAGEVKAITPLSQAIRKAVPGVQILITTTSPTGKKMVLENESADAVFLAPLDMEPCVQRALKAFQPTVYLIAETEFWPNALRLVSQSGISVLLINGRISNKSFPSYRKLKSLFTPALHQFNGCFVQTEGDKDKLLALGVPDEKISVVGQLKYDLAPPDAMAVEKFKETLSFLRKDILFTFGSIRTGEDDLLFPAIPELLRLSPDVRILLAPRHLKNTPVFRDKLTKMGVTSTLKSQIRSETFPERVILLDSMGELAVSYALSRAAFVGGTLIPIEGHNVMEPALASVPVCFGPHTKNVEEAAQALIQSEGGFQVRETSQIVETFKKFMDEDFAQKTGKKAHQSVLAMRGATEKTVQGVLKWWPS